MQFQTMLISPELILEQAKDSETVQYKKNGVPIPDVRNEQGDIIRPQDQFAFFRKQAIQDFMLRGWNHFIVLAGAGASITNVDKGASGKTMPQLAEVIASDIDSINRKSGKKIQPLYSLVELAVICHAKFEENGKSQDFSSVEDVSNHFEDFLTQVEQSSHYLTRKAVKVKKTMSRIYALIRYHCDLTFSESSFSHATFLKSLVALASSTGERLDVFTTNYDTLIEQAATKLKYNIIDGFAYSQQPTFSGEFFDLDFVDRTKIVTSDKVSYVPNVFRLFKLHGSVTWKKQGDEAAVVTKLADPALNGFYNGRNVQTIPTSVKYADQTDEDMMIFPRSNKYEQSYQQPYFELFLRFQQALRTPNSLIVVIGFSFGDMHIRNMVVNALRTNGSLGLLFVNYKIDSETVAWLYEMIEERYPIILFRGTLAQFTENIPMPNYLEVERGEDNYAQHQR